MKNNVAFSVRLNLENAEDKKAWKYLQNINRRQYPSYSRIVVMAVNAYFDNSLSSTNYDETALLSKLSEVIQDTIKQELSKLSLPQNTTYKSEEVAIPEHEEEIDIALDFADSF